MLCDALVAFRALSVSMAVLFGGANRLWREADTQIAACAGSKREVGVAVGRRAGTGDLAEICG
jgi:uncharacterized membrane protein